MGKLCWCRKYPCQVKLNDHQRTVAFSYHKEPVSLNVCKVQNRVYLNLQRKKQKISVKIESDFLINAVCRENQDSIFTLFLEVGICG